MTGVTHAAFVLPLVIAACASDPYAAYEPVPPAELAQIAAGRSLLTGGTADWPLQTALYLAPDGSGWRDGRLARGTEPAPGDMAMVLRWWVTAEDGLCLWSTPLIGAMPSFAPPEKHCLHVSRAPGQPDALAATPADAKRGITAPLQIAAGNIFPAPRIAQYELQVRVLYGGSLMNWSIP